MKIKQKNKNIFQLKRITKRLNYLIPELLFSTDIID